MYLDIVVDVKQVEKLLLKTRKWTSRKTGEECKAINLHLVGIPCRKGANHFILKQKTNKEEEKQFPDLPIIGCANEKGDGARPPPNESAPSTSSAPADNQGEEEEDPF